LGRRGSRGELIWVNLSGQIFRIRVRNGSKMKSTTFSDFS